MIARINSSLGIFDSGVGGLSVLRAIRALLPNQSAIYFADQIHVPYGLRPIEEVREFSIEISRFFSRLGIKVIVVACNTASAAALHYLRVEFPGIRFVGMEPAVKPAVEVTETKIVGVIATPATFQGTLYASVVERFAGGVTLIQNTCPGLVDQIEIGALDHPVTRKILESALHPMMEKGVDTIVLGCTHYPFVIPLIQSIVGPMVRVIDPSPAVARQTSRQLAMIMEIESEKSNELAFFTSRSGGRFADLLPTFLGEMGIVYEINWSGRKLSD